MTALYSPTKACDLCQGRCCKYYPGCFMPHQIKTDMLETLRHKFHAGLWAVDWWEGDPRPGMNELTEAYVIRPAIVGAKRLFDPSWGGQCVFLGESGCKLSWDERPDECRALRPRAADDPDGECRGVLDKQKVAIAWLPFRPEILRAGGRNPLG